MANTTVVFGIILILLGVGSYFGTDRISPTALIPAVLGLPIAIMGVLARKEGLRKHVMHVAALLAVIGFIGSFSGIPQFVKVMSGQTVARANGSLVSPAAIYAKAAMAALCLIFVIMCVNSFIQARKSRTV